jgi:hypothetical protein
MSQVLTSGTRGDCLVLLLLVMFRWSEIAAAGGCEAPALLNKLDLRSDLLDLASSLHLSADLRGGERRVGGGELDTATWSTSSTVHRRPTAAIPSFQIAEGRLLRDLALLRRRQLFINLLASEPNGSPPSSFSVAFIVDPAPSGFVPGNGEDGYAVRLRSVLGGEGLYCILICRSRVHFPFSEDLVLVWFFVKILDVICSPTDEI